MNIDEDADEQTFVCADGARLRYSTGGTGQPAVLIHGLGLDAGMWEPQWAALKHEFRAIRYDLRGFGGSSLPGGSYSHSDDLLGLLDHLDARPAHVIGLSMGGRIALRFAIDHPEAVKSLTLIGSALEGHAWSAEWLRDMNAIVNDAKRGNLDAAKQRWLAHRLFEPARRHPPLAAALSAMVERYSAWHWQHADPVRRAAVPAIDALSTLRCPTLVLVGELDLPDFHVIARRLAADIPRTALHTLPGAGHMANMEAPAAVNGRVLAHLRACARG